MKTTSQPIAGDLTICRKMMRKKPITETENDQLNKCMGFWDIVLQLLVFDQYWRNTWLRSIFCYWT